MYRMVRKLDSWRMDMAVDRVELIDCQSKAAGSLHTKLVTLLDPNQIEGGVMQASLEYKPSILSSGGQHYDYRAELKTSSALTVIVNPVVVQNILSVFSTNEELDTEFAAEAASLYGSWKARREREWREALASRQNWLCAVEVTAPILVFPEDCYNSNSSELALDLGTM